MKSSRYWISKPKKLLCYFCLLPDKCTLGHEKKYGKHPKKSMYNVLGNLTILPYFIRVTRIIETRCVFTNIRNIPLTNIYKIKVNVKTISQAIRQPFHSQGL